MRREPNTYRYMIYLYSGGDDGEDDSSDAEEHVDVGPPHIVWERVVLVAHGIDGRNDRTNKGNQPRKLV